MKYSISAYDKAENELKRRREAVMNEHEVHAQEIAQRLPEIEVLTRSLKANNCELMKGIVGKMLMEENIYKNASKQCQY